MWRKLTIVALTAIVVAAGLFWIVTEPVTVSALPAYVADATRGRTVFDAGGCSSCHASVDQDDRTVLGGGVAIPSPFGTFYAPNISPNPVDGIGRWSEANFVTAVLKGTSPGGQHYFPAFPYTSYQRMTARGRARPLCLLEDAAAGRRQGEGSRRRVSVQHPPPRRRLEVPVSRRQAVRAGSGEIGGVESRRLSRQWAGPLCGVS